MGSISLGAIAGADALGFDDDPVDFDAAMPIGPLNTHSTANACVVEMRDGAFLFTREVPLDASFERRWIDADGGEFRWIRLEFKAAEKEKSVSVDDVLVVAQIPYASNWAAGAPFKRRRRETDNVDDVAHAASVADAESIIEDLAFDYWELGKYRTSGFMGAGLGPAFSEPTQATRRDSRFAVGLLMGAATLARGREAPLQVAEAAILASPRLQESLRLTEIQEIKYAPRRVSVPPIAPAVAENRYQIMCQSVRQALAGPEDSFDQWIGEPVERLADQLYRDTLLREMKREMSRSRNEGEIPRRRNDDDGRDDEVETIPGLIDDGLHQHIEAIIDKARKGGDDVSEKD